MSTMSDDKVSHCQEGVFSIRAMSPEECEESFDIVSKEEGWNLTLPKLKKLIQVYPSNVFVMINIKSQEIVATVNALPGNPGQYVVGNLVVKETHRRKGLGKKLVTHLLEIHKGQILTLTAVPGVDGFYRKCGFEDVGPTHYINYLEVDRAKLETACSEYAVDEIHITSYMPDLQHALEDYDESARGYNARKFLSFVVETTHSLFVAMSKPRGEVLGYVSGVDMSSEVALDGLFADSDVIALALFRKLADSYQDHGVFRIQTIKPRDFLLQFGHVLPTSHSYKRMATGATAPWALSKSYAVFDCNFSE